MFRRKSNTQKGDYIKVKKESKKNFCVAGCLLVAFVLWTVAICFVDVQAIGPRESIVGFATINGFIHNFTGVHMSLYTITDWLGLVPLGFMLGFALLGLIQWIKRKSIDRVDCSILILGGFYIVMMTAYVLFEIFVVNYRPILINGCLEVSYPSSTTVFVMCVMPTAMMQFNVRIRNRIFRRWADFAIVAFIVFMVIGRFLSGVHWFTDIIGGTLLSAGLVMIYSAVLNNRDVE